VGGGAVSNYPMIVYTLHEFDLITTEQADQAIENYNLERAEMRHRQEAFVKEWKKRTPWWKKLFGPGWATEWIDAERGR
jgi:hypothetical protein